jgi:nucleoside-diphosphate-sugar epimerase
MRVFLTGASGYIGTAVATALGRAAHQVSGLARSDEAERRLRARGVRPVRGDLTDPAVLEQAAREADGVIHTASTNDARAAEVDARAVEALLAGLTESGKPFIYTSGIWVHGDTGGRVVDESSPLEPAGIVAWRPAVERKVLDAAARGVRAVVIRPAMVYGNGGGIPAMLARSARQGGAAQHVGSGRNRWPVVHVEDLAELYLLALERAPAGTVLLAANSETVTLGEIARAASEGAGAGGKTTAWALPEAREVIGPLADALALDQRVSSVRARQLLGWVPRGRGILDELRAGR